MSKYSSKEGYKSYAKAKGGSGVKKEKGYQYPITKPKKRKGWDDSGKYEDGGVVGGIEDRVKVSSLEMLEKEMASLGGEGLFGELTQRFKDGGVVKSESYEDEEEYEEENDEEDFGDYSRSELIEMLRRR